MFNKRFTIANLCYFSVRLAAFLFIAAIMTRLAGIIPFSVSLGLIVAALLIGALAVSGLEAVEKEVMNDESSRLPADERDRQKV